MFCLVEIKVLKVLWIRANMFNAICLICLTQIHLAIILYFSDTLWVLVTLVTLRRCFPVPVDLQLSWSSGRPSSPIVSSIITVTSIPIRTWEVITTGRAYSRRRYGTGRRQLKPSASEYRKRGRGEGNAPNPFLCTLYLNKICLNQERQRAIEICFLFNWMCYHCEVKTEQQSRSLF